MGLLDKIKERRAESKQFKLQKAAAYKQTRKKARAEYLREKERAELEQVRAKARRDARPLKFKLKEGLTTVRGVVRQVQQKQAKNAALELPKRELYTVTKSPDELLGFPKKEAALPKKKLNIKRRVVYEYE